MKRDWPSTKAWKQALACLAAAMLGWPQAAPPVAAAEAIAEGRPVFPGAKECPYDLPPRISPQIKWTEQEKWAWGDMICLGDIADMSKFGGGDGLPCDPEEADKWPETRNLSPAFLETILNHEPYRGALPRTGVRIQCARFNEVLDLRSMVLEHPLWLYASRFRQNVVLKDLRSSSLVLLSESVFDGLFNAGRLAVAGNLFIRDARFKKEVRLLNAKVGGDLYASGSAFDDLFTADGLEVAGDLIMDEGAHFKNEVRLLGAKVGGNLDANDSTFEDLFNASGLEVAGHLFMKKAHFEKVRLHGAKVGGQLSAKGSSFKGVFNANRLEVAQSLFIDEEARFKKEFSLLNAKVGGDLYASDSTFDDLFTADGLEVAGDLFMNKDADKCAHFKKVRLLNAKVGGNLDASGSTFEGLFNASGLEVAGNLFMRDGASFKDVRLIGAVIGESLQIRDSDFDGHLKLTSVSIGDELHLSSPRAVEKRKPGKENFSPPRWSEQAKLTLRNAHVGVLNDLKNAWGLQPDHLDLVGFTYDRLGGLNATSASAMSARSIEWLKEWLAKQDGFEKFYNPQPFEQLAKVLRQSGYPGKADSILIAARTHQRDSPATHWLTQVKLWILWGLIGYGYHNWIALLWFAALTGLGAWACGMSPFGRRMRAAQRYWYSFDMALPLITLNKRHEAVKLRGGVLVYFYGHKLAGFVLVSFLVAGLSGLTK